jgi:hypothetical protein
MSDSSIPAERAAVFLNTAGNFTSDPPDLRVTELVVIDVREHRENPAPRKHLRKSWGRSRPIG